MEANKDTAANINSKLPVGKKISLIITVLSTEVSQMHLTISKPM